jgi:hypothetical protein
MGLALCQLASLVSLVALLGKERRDSSIDREIGPYTYVVSVRVQSVQNGENGMKPKPNYRIKKKIDLKVKRPGVLGRHKRTINTTTKPVVVHEQGIDQEKRAYQIGWNSIRSLTDPIPHRPPDITVDILVRAYELGQLHRRHDLEGDWDKERRLDRIKARKHYPKPRPPKKNPKPLGIFDEGYKLPKEK